MSSVNFVVLDFETDPFEHGYAVHPFVWDIFDGKKHVSYWGDDCIEQLVAFLKHRKHPWLIYAHNGGKFDYMFLLKWIRGSEMLIINNRIVEAKLLHHKIRDSYSAIPVPLSAMEKDEIDYRMMRSYRRHRHYKKIVKYLHKDTEGLYKYVKAYREMFGSKAVTMAGAAIKQLKKYHHYETMPESVDTMMRKYFHGGRVECFETGVIEMKGKIFDVNSMYPSVMRNFLHPISSSPLPGDRIVKKTCFVDWRGESMGAMPVMAKDPFWGTSLSFPHGKGDYHCTIHEFQAGLETGTIKVDKILGTYDFLESSNFADFIDRFYDLRMEAKSTGDEVNTLFYKLVMNSAYGKFAQNPRDFCDYEITSDLSGKKHCTCKEWKQCKCNGWILASVPGPDYVLWKRKVKPQGIYGNYMKGFHNVATAASITGAARSLLLRAIVSADRPLYCDTDSLICRDLTGVEIDDKKLSAWKLEETFDTFAVAGKKMYVALKNGEYVKSASKGVDLPPEEIIKVASGGEAEYHNPAPSMKFDGSQQFIQRRVRNTARVAKPN